MYNQPMDIKGRILQSLRPRRDGVLLRSDVNAFGSSTQVSFALKSLLDKKLIERVGHGIYAKPSVVQQVGKQALQNSASARAKQIRSKSFQRSKKLRLTLTARYVEQLAKLEGISFKQTYADHWANSVTKISGDEVRSDTTDDLLVALTRSGKLTPSAMVKLVIAHHRELANV